MEPDHEISIKFMNRLRTSRLLFSGYVGDDYPEVWPIERKTILMTFDNPKHFRLDTDDGRAEWAAIAPGNGGRSLGAAQTTLHSLDTEDREEA